MLTMFKEGGPGSPVSMRRVLAFMFGGSAVATGILAAPFAAAGWWVFLPTGIFVIATLFLLFFTTWSDVVAIINAAKGKP